MSRRRSSLTRGPFVGTTCMRSSSSSSESSSGTIRLPGDQLADGTTQKRQNPPTLRLPFDNRQRESHLVTDEEFDEIAKSAFQDELFDAWQQPKIRRSMSTARHSWFSNFAPRTRPASYAAETSRAEPADKLRQALESWQKELNRQQEGTVWQSGSQRVVGQETSSFTALPDPPTKNNLAEYPSKDVSLVKQLPDNDGSSTQPRRSISTTGRSTPRNVVPGSTPNKTKHKRGFSIHAVSANVAEAFKKHVFGRKTLPPLDVAVDYRSTADTMNKPNGHPHAAAAAAASIAAISDAPSSTPNHDTTPTDCMQHRHMEIYNGQLSNNGNSNEHAVVQTKQKTRKMTASSSTTVPSVASTWATTTAATTPLGPVADPVLGFTPHTTSNAAAYQAVHGVFSSSDLPAYTKEQLHIIIVQQRAYISNLELQNKCVIEQMSNLRKISTKSNEEIDKLRDDTYKKDILISKLENRIKTFGREGSSKSPWLS